jgi:uncharacterized damage-inducible protein DinB
MSDLTTLLDEALEAWEYTRAGFIEEAAVIPADAYDFRPASGSRSVLELVIHVVEAGLMAAGELSDPEGGFPRRSYPEHVRAHAGHLPREGSKEELLELLERTGAEGRRRVRAAGELALLQLIRRFDGERGTRLAWLYHAVDHESYHRGQLALYARLLGQVPVLTRRIQGD